MSLNCRSDICIRSARACERARHTLSQVTTRIRDHQTFVWTLVGAPFPDCSGRRMTISRHPSGSTRGAGTNDFCSSERECDSLVVAEVVRPTAKSQVALRTWACTYSPRKTGSRRSRNDVMPSRMSFVGTMRANCAASTASPSSIGRLVPRVTLARQAAMASGDCALRR